MPVASSLSTCHRYTCLGTCICQIQGTHTPRRGIGIRNRIPGIGLHTPHSTRPHGHMPHAVALCVFVYLTSNLFMAFYQFYFHSSLCHFGLVFVFIFALRIFVNGQLGLAARLLAYPLNATCAALVRRACWPRQPLEAPF